ncbi:Rha family transcriptional regulator [Eisenbergiella tayi]|uniref:Phage regulatory protein Rha (Phage pRha) n=1 Tax=Eisenbergiella tayi TaxID=1432052 RepID=A0A1E3A315_9FIRM|nr:Rha family transcriptional regulator [Eisenbergiella tayi]ODM03172.1 Phage regulatory protein Rha (Phage pRha) [Eisenbergiella tayi]
MNDLVKLKGNDIFTDSLVIAQGTGNQHHAVRELIKKYKDDIEDFGTLLISNEESTGGRPIELFLMNEEQATFLMTLLKNSKKVVAFKKELVRQFYEMRRILLERQSPHWQATRLESKEIKALVFYLFYGGRKPKLIVRTFFFFPQCLQP